MSKALMRAGTIYSFYAINPDDMFACTIGTEVNFNARPQTDVRFVRILSVWGREIDVCVFFCPWPVHASNGATHPKLFALVTLATAPATTPRAPLCARSPEARCRTRPPPR
jgi:hypothetical protein